MDLGSIVESDTAEYELVTPVDKIGTGIIFILAGPEHPKRKQIAQAAARSMRKNFARTGKFAFDDPVEEVDKETDYLVACTLGWKNLTLKGEAISFSEGAARMLYEDRERAWLRRQIKGALDEQENFIKSSSGD